MATSINDYYTLPVLSTIKLPSGSEYVLIDVAGRLMIAPQFNANTTYEIGDHVLYGGSSKAGNKLYRFRADHEGAWTGTDVDEVTVDDEIKRLEGLIAGGVHYRGKTTTPLFDGATSGTSAAADFPTITIGGHAYTPEAGDLVIVNLANVATNYTSGILYHAHTYIKNGSVYYITNSEIPAVKNTSLEAIQEWIDLIKTEPEFIYDGTDPETGLGTWNVFGSIAEGLGNLAFKDKASGTVYIPTDASINTGSSKLKTVSYSVVADTDREVSKVVIKNSGTSQGDVQDIKIGDAAITGTSAFVTGLTGTTEFCTNAIKNAYLTGTVSFATEAVKDVRLTYTTDFATEGVTTSVDEDCLFFATAGIASVGVTATPVMNASVGIATDAADKESFDVATDIYYVVSSTTYTIDVTGATAAIRDTNKKTLATGALDPNDASGATVVVSVGSGDDVADVNLTGTDVTI